ncbi:MAG: sensor histidine kinase [Roseateles sp.]|uniref:sensor histidine kinase n=1 Tax=Roseateles sp. TaxID=1971397 RepID=UPI004035875F
METSLANRWLARIEPRAILWAGGTLALALVVAGGLSAVLLWRDLIGNAEAEVQRTVRLLSQHAARVIEPVDHTLREIDSALEEAGQQGALMTPLQVHELMRPFATVGPYLVRVVALDERGRFRGASDRATAPADLHLDDAWLREVRGSGQALQVGLPLASRASNHRVVPLARPLTDSRTQAFRGVVVAALGLDQLQAFHHDMQLSQGWQVALLRDDGMVLTGAAPGTQWRPTSGIAGQGRFALGDETGELVRWRPAEDAQVLVGLRRVGAWPLLVAVSVDAATVVAPWRRRALALLSITLPAAAGVMGLSWLGAGALRRTRGLSRSLGASTARYRSLVESSPDGILIARGGVIEYANAAITRLAQVGNASQLVGRRVDTLLGGNTARHATDEFDGPPPGRAISVEHWLHPVGGGSIEVETVIADGAPGDDDSLQIVVRDISARKQAHRRLRDSEERYRLMVEGAPDCAFLLLDMDGVIEDVKPITSQVVLGRRLDLLGRPLGTLFTLDATARDEPMRMLRQARAAQAPQDREGWCRRTEGGRFWAHLVLSPLADEDEQPRGFHVLVRDISARKRLQDELDANRRKLETLALASEAAREREKIRIARELHDELGQMLTVQQMDVEMLADELGTAPTGVRERIAAMRAHVDSALEMTRRIAGDLRPLVLDDLGLAAALQWLLAQARSRCRIEGQLELEGDASAMPDELATALFRIAQESMTNVMRHARASRVGIRLVIDGQGVTLSVSDDGRGLDAGAVHHGLGLMGIEERARLLGGHAAIGPREGGGTSVRVRLPVTGVVQAAREGDRA